MRWLARHRVTALIVVVGLVAVLAAAYAGRHDQAYAAAYDPGNPDGNGAQAVARVLDHEGVDVEVVRSADALDRTTADGATTIVVTSTDHLGITTTARLLQHQGAADLVVVDPGPQLVRDLGLRSYPRSARLGDDVAAGCPTYDGLVVRVSAGATYDAPGCFRTGGGSLLAEPRHRLTLLGASDVLTNDQILEGDNAAVALRLLGARRHLVWYVPDLADLGGADSVSAASLLPDWLVPSLWLLGTAGVALVVWRARRLGPLAREPLPVEVKAVETTRNLGRLYRRSGDRGHAAEALRLAARTRIADRLRLPRRTDPSLLATDVAARTGRPLTEVESLLGPTTGPPADDRALAALAQQLTELDREVSHR
jgi:uncharacterized protein DUF4350